MHCQGSNNWTIHWIRSTEHHAINVLSLKMASDVNFKGCIHKPKGVCHLPKSFNPFSLAWQIHLLHSMLVFIRLKSIALSSFSRLSQDLNVGADCSIEMAQCSLSLYLEQMAYLHILHIWRAVFKSFIKCDRNSACALKMSFLYVNFFFQFILETGLIIAYNNNERRDVIFPDF